MLNQVFQLVRPKNIMIKYEDISVNQNDKVLVRPLYMALCHADQRLFSRKERTEYSSEKVTDGV